MTSPSVEGACGCCLQARQNKKGEWHCASHQPYFPAAPWGGEDEYHPTSCPSFKPDMNWYHPED